MEENLKQLLLKDLCARLPYGVVVNTPKGDGHLCSINQTLFGNEYGVNIKATRRDYFNDNECDIKPYLRPMSSMTDEERKEYELLANHCIVTSIGFIHLEAAPLTDWLNKYHFDYRGLIEKNLALDCTGLHIYD